MLPLLYSSRFFLPLPLHQPPMGKQCAPPPTSLHAHPRARLNERSKRERRTSSLTLATCVAFKCASTVDNGKARLARDKCCVQQRGVGAREENKYACPCSSPCAYFFLLACVDLLLPECLSTTLVPSAALDGVRSTHTTALSWSDQHLRGPAWCPLFLQTKGGQNKYKNRLSAGSAYEERK